ncbi:MAG: diaminopimelate decarboxylase [Proteobacteria bacterium]|nr:diaminopimelate decarboxylase [Pseudomonadota bacterium]
MNEFRYAGGVLHAEGVPLAAIADAVGTPVYCYSSAAIESAYRAYEAAFAGRPMRICYALKANGNLAVVRTLANLGAGADVVSEGEMRRALAAGVPASRIVFSGVGKAPTEMAFALGRGIHQINVESVPELETLSEIASARGMTAPVALRINPDVDAGTHAKITTGRRENKFGIDHDQAVEIYARAAILPGIEPVGLAVHIGSQLTDVEPFRRAFTRLAELVTELRGRGLSVTRLDLGGGLGIVYRDEAETPHAAYAAIVEETVGGLGCELAIEPGRSLVGNAGVLLTRVLYVKQAGSRRIVIVDAAMNDLIRPALYEAHHGIRPVAPRAGTESPADVVGPVCETADTFAVARPLAPVEPGDLMVLDSAGAYAAAMASGYNGRLPVPEVLVRGGDYAVVKPRPSFEDILDQDRIPDWLAALPTSERRGAA